MVSVSVAMATFNGERYLREQLASLAAQSHLPSELVITDDGSTDNTLNLIGDFAAGAPFPVHLHRNDRRLGYRANFLRATTLCGSDLIAFCDQDDVWDPRKIEICLPLFSNSEVLLAYHNAVKITADAHPIGLLNDWVLTQQINPPMSIGSWPFVKGFTQVFRRSLPYSSDLWEMSVDYADARERMAHDQWFFFFSSVLGSIAYIKEPLAYYRLHSSNAVGILGPERLSDRARLFFANSAEKYTQFERGARACATILDRAKKDWSGTWHQRASIGAEKYRALEQRYADRKLLYTAVEPSRRLRAFRSILLSGGYNRYDGYNFGFRSLAKDALLGVLVGRRLKRFSEM
jgi:glycosyltransferase involved in cell wall biosynthesis